MRDMILPPLRAVFLLALAAALSCRSPRPAPEPAPVAPAPPADELRIRRIDLIHLTHTDIGFTDHPAICRELHRRYLDVALDAILATRGAPEEAKFRWTAEAMLSVADWWESAPPGRRQEFLRAIGEGQLEIAALPCNQAPFLDPAEWRTMLHWVPDDLWRSWRPRVAIQNDVNGLPRAGAIGLLDRGVRFLIMGINADSGGPPLPAPTAFWWKMPDGRRLLVWQGHHYAGGYDFFHAQHWRRGPVPAAADLAYRPPRPGEQFAADEASVRRAHALCVKHLRQMEKGGYPHATLILPTTNQWRIDNDPPLPQLADFVASWNRLGLRPELRLSTPSEAMERLDRESGAKLPEHSGEWTDWWANGMASNPRELAASRRATRALDAALSPVWGEADADGRARAEAILRDLCLCDEHTAGAALSVADPDSVETLGQFNEKGRLAYKPLADAEWLLAQRARARLHGVEPGVHVVKPYRGAWSGWVRLPANAFREKCGSLEDPATGKRYRLLAEPGFQPWGRPQKPGDLTRENMAAVFPDNVPGQTVKFWVDGLPPQSILALRVNPQRLGADAAAKGPAVEVDDSGWPVAATWEGMRKPLFAAGFGDFLSVGVKGFAPRGRLGDISGTGDPDRREKRRQEVIEEVAAAPEGKAGVEENEHEVLYTQWLRHPRLQWAVRTLELWRREPRARLTLRFYRTSSDAPERFFAVFPVPVEGALPVFSNGGVPFTPFADQIPGSCRDYFAVDGWAHYAAPEGNWLWSSRDAALVSFGRPPVWDRRKEPPKETGRLLAMLFDNFWYTNFTGNCHGAMAFRFDLAWREKLEAGEREGLAGALAADPVVSVVPAMKEDPILIRRLDRP
jgi:hypothetical protein